MRKIASRLGFTATTIYNYYNNKDEINLMIRIKGFEKLYDMLKKRSAPFNNLEVKLTAMLRAYIEFGLNYPAYYDMMFDAQTSRYQAYLDTCMEALANKSRKNVLKCLFLFIQPISDYIPSKGKLN